MLRKMERNNLSVTFSKVHRYNRKSVILLYDVQFNNWHSVQYI